ncbi:MAG: tetratricopeptide repeat protein [Planctomycetes bacterium]|nr:tetratricopeptide repeat protein [Planctomycetota bacterium]
MDDYLQAVEAARRVTQLYPGDPGAYVLLADCLLEAGAVAAGEPESDAAEEPLREAINTYRRALELDDSRPAWERIRGFRDRERRAITAGIQRAEQVLQTLRK